MPAAEISLAYYNTEENERKNFNPFPKPTTFSFVDSKGKLRIICPFKYKEAKIDFKRRLRAEFAFIAAAEDFCNRCPDFPLEYFNLLHKDATTYTETFKINFALHAEHISMPDLLKYEKFLDIATRRKYGAEITILLRIFLYCKLISRAKVYGNK